MRNFRIGSVLSIPIELNISFLLVLPIWAWLIATQVEQLISIFNDLFAANLTADILTSGVTPYLLGGLSAIVFFGGVVLHEIGHSVVSAWYGYEVDAITLWFLGGIAQITEMPEDWKQELTVAIAGPIVSIILSAISYMVFLVVPPGFEVIRFVLVFLVGMNIGIALFNLLPGFPLDGGRVLRALLARDLPYATATQRAASVGKAIAILLGLVGMLSFNLFLIFIALFIYANASSEAQRVVQKAAFEGVAVYEVMTPAEQVNAATPDMSVRELLDRMFTERHTGYPVVENDELVGLVTLNDAREIHEAEQDAFCVEEIMATDLQTIPADEEVMNALSMMQQNGVGRLPVIEAQGNFVGILTRTDLMNALQIVDSMKTTNREETTK